MTESSILPGAAPTTESGIDMVPPGTDVEETDGGDRRKLMIIGGIAAVVVLVVVAFVLLHKGSASDGTFVPHSTQAAPPPSSSKLNSPTKGASNGASSTDTGGTRANLPKRSHAAQVRDPFHPLVTAPVDTSGGATSTTTVTAPTTSTDGSTSTGSTTGTSPTDGNTDGSTGSTSGTGTTGATSSATGPLWIQLMNVHGRMATFDVGYAHHKFRRFHVQAPLASSHQATVFDTVFALVGISGGQVTLQIGDDAPFQLTTGIAHTVGG